MTRQSLFMHPIHLGLGGTAVAQPELTGMEWYSAYSERVASDGKEGRLVSLYDFAESWDSWEMHPVGDEVVVCLRGELTLHQEFADREQRAVHLGIGDYVINPPGVWHTADVVDSALALFITAGEGTLHRAR